LRTLFALLVAFALAASLAAQTKISGTLQCGKADPSYSIPVGDRPGHAFVIEKGTCTWTKPVEIVGTQSKVHEMTNFHDVMGERVRSRAAAVGTLASGDKYFLVAQGSSISKEGVALSFEGTWSYTGGTGKLKGIKGKGTYKGTSNPDGTITHEVEGEYILP